MLTPQEISDKKFVKAVFGGYDMTEVDDFLASLGEDYNSLYKENAILKGKLKVLVEKVEEYRTTEDAMRMALLTAQRTGDEIMLDANKRKEELMREIEDERQDMLTHVSNRVSAEEARLQAAAKETAKFIELSQAIMRKHSEFLSKLESARRIVTTVPKPTVETNMAPPPEPPRTREQQISQSAAEIDDAMYQRNQRSQRNQRPNEYAPAPPAAPRAAQGQRERQPEPQAYDMQARQHRVPEPHAELAFDDENEPTRPYPFREDDASTPRPKFDFDNLKFGSNFNNDDD